MTIAKDSNIFYSVVSSLDGLGMFIYFIYILFFIQEVKVAYIAFPPLILPHNNPVRLSGTKSPDVLDRGNALQGQDKEPISREESDKRSLSPAKNKHLRQAPPSFTQK